MIRASEWRARRWLKRCAHVGKVPYLAGRPIIRSNSGRIHIGDGLRLASLPVPSHLVSGDQAALEIGDDVCIGHGAAIAAFQHVRIGSGTHIGPFVIIMDTNFHGDSGDQSVQHDTRPVVIGKECRIGSRVTITRGAIIGDGAEILAGSVVSSEIPPGACAAGVRARVIGYANDSASRWNSPAAELPEMLMTALDLTAPPDLDDRLAGLAQWSEQQIAKLLAAIEHRFGVSLDPGTVGACASYLDVAALLQGALEPKDANGVNSA